MLVKDLQPPLLEGQRRQSSMLLENIKGAHPEILFPLFHFVISQPCDKVGTGNIAV